MRYELIVFDLDGTVLDTIEDIAFWMNIVLQEMGLPLHTVEAYKKLVGSGIDALAINLLPEKSRTSEKVSEFVNRFRLFYQDGWKRTSDVFPGIREGLLTLQNQGVKLAVLSNKPHDLTVDMIKFLLPNIYFERIYGERLFQNIPVKPDPQSLLIICEELGVSVKNTVMVGDTEADILTAQNAGASSIGVSWGFREPFLLEADQPDFLVHTPAELFEVLLKNKEV